MSIPHAVIAGSGLKMARTGSYVSYSNRYIHRFVGFLNGWNALPSKPNALPLSFERASVCNAFGALSNGFAVSNRVDPRRFSYFFERGFHKPSKHAAPQQITHGPAHFGQETISVTLPMV